MASLSNVKLTLNEAIRANLHGNKRILKWRPFWNKVYAVSRISTTFLFCNEAVYLQNLIEKSQTYTFLLSVCSVKKTASSETGKIVRKCGFSDFMLHVVVFNKMAVSH